MSLKYVLPTQNQTVAHNPFDNQVKRDISKRYIDDLADLVGGASNIVCFPGEEALEVAEIHAFFPYATVFGIEKNKPTFKLMEMGLSNYDKLCTLLYGPASTQIKKITAPIDAAHLDFLGKPGEESFDAVLSYAGNLISNNLQHSVLRITHASWGDRGRPNQELVLELRTLVNDMFVHPVSAENIPIAAAYGAYLEKLIGNEYTIDCYRNYRYSSGKKDMYTFWFSIYRSADPVVAGLELMRQWEEWN